MGALWLSRVSLYTVLSFLLAGCGGGGGTATTPEDVQTGSFLDGPVCGIQYTTPRWNGITEQEGLFNYQEGEPVTFSIGNVVLGTARANRFVTPVDLVPGAADATDPVVINICRFLQSLDHDANPKNGITISRELRDALMGFSVNFTDPDFDQNPEVQRLLDYINSIPLFEEERCLVSAEDALIHFEDTLIEIEGILAEEEGRDLAAAIARPVGNAILIQGQAQSIRLEGRKIGGTAPYSYVWDVGDETGFSEIEDPGLVSFYTTGNFPVLFTVMDANGNTASDHRLVTVVSSQVYGPIPGKDEKAQVVLTNPDNSVTVRQNTAVHLKAEITQGNPPFYYFWAYPKTATYSFSENPLDASFRFRSAGRHTVSITVIDSWNQDDWTCTMGIVVEE